MCHSLRLKIIIFSYKSKFITVPPGEDKSDDFAMPVVAGPAVPASPRCIGGTVAPGYQGLEGNGQWVYVSHILYRLVY